MNDVDDTQKFSCVACSRETDGDPSYHDEIDGPLCDACWDWQNDKIRDEQRIAALEQETRGTRRRLLAMRDEKYHSTMRERAIAEKEAAEARVAELEAGLKRIASQAKRGNWARRIARETLEGNALAKPGASDADEASLGADVCRISGCGELTPCKDKNGFHLCARHGGAADADDGGG